MTQATSPAIDCHRFTVGDYYRTGTFGILTTDDRVELLDGEVVAMTQ